MTMGTALPAFLSILLNWKCIAVALAIAITSVVSLFYQRVSRYPRGPFPIPLFGNLLVLRKIENLHIKAIEWSKTYGDVFTLWIAHNPMVILNSHDVIRETLAKQNLLFAGRSSTKMRDIQTQGNHDIMFEDCTPYWKALRKVASLAVRRYALTRTVEKLCVDVVDAYVDTLAPGPQVIDSRKLFFSMLYKLTGASVYGESTYVYAGEGHFSHLYNVPALRGANALCSLNGEQRDIRRLEEIDHEYYGIVPNGLPSDIAPFLGLLYYKREKRVEVMYKEYREIVYRLFAKAEESYRPDSKENIVHCLLTARQEAIQEKESDAVYLTKENLVQVVMNLFGGATDTSASTLQWIFLRLVKHPEIQKRIQKEIEDNIGSRPPTYEDREKLPFTMACMLETFRCHPFTPVGMPHRTTADTKVGTTVIPKDTGVLYNVYRANRDPNLWEEPEEFQPDRFLDHATGRLRQDAGLTFTFGAGARACPGMKLAHVDIFYILVRFMQKVSCTAVGSTSSVTMKSIRSSLFSIPAQRDIIFCKRR